MEDGFDFDEWQEGWPAWGAPWAAPKLGRQGKLKRQLVPKLRGKVTKAKLLKGMKGRLKGVSKKAMAKGKGGKKKGRR